MGKPRRPAPVKLFVGMLGADGDLLRRARQMLTRRYGAADVESALWPFTFTSYYETEMGPSLLRGFVAFEMLIAPERLAAIKRETNEMEERLAADCEALDIARPVNLDPGYLDLGKLVLATTKDRAHRIYLDAGIFAEVTLQYAQEAWQPSPWTYPDFRSPEYAAYFTQVRERLAAQRAQLERTLLAPPAPPSTEPA
ncbi:MAG: DUF4416 family protein [Phycisphaerae bacterium]